MMKKIHVSRNPAEIGLMKGWLESEGIACVTRNDQIALASGSVPFLDCLPELWVLNDEDWQDAQDLIACLNTAPTKEEPWRCPRCGEENEGQFAACWKCEFLIDAA